MKIKIIKVYEKNRALRVETECEFGKDNIGLSLESQYLDPITQKPRWQGEVRKLLENKYQKELVEEKDVFKESWGKNI